MDSLTIYDCLPEDKYFDNSLSKLASSVLIGIIAKKIVNNLIVKATYSAQKDLPYFAALLFRLQEDNSVSYELELYSLSLVCINYYKTSLKNQRIGKSFNLISKTNAQLYNYYIQNILSVYEMKKNEKKMTLFSLDRCYKVWDATFINDQLMAIVDSDKEKSLKLYDMEDLKLIASFKCELPTKCTNIANVLYIHSTYAYGLCVYKHGKLFSCEHNKSIRVIYYCSDSIFALDDSYNIYEIIEQERDFNLSYIKNVAFNSNYFIDSYCQCGTKVYCSSHTSSDTLIFDAKTYEYQFRRLGDVHMPNSIEIIDDMLYVCDKETGRVSVFKLDTFEPVEQFGYFSRKSFGNADTMKVIFRKQLNIKELYIFSWLKSSIIKVEL